ncbi:malonic semialdehyde reductase [Saccharospirillum sp. MSK14-1]|uniref:malonic semialdehyde reductase n=1 Tax=Saccharospirillum sp. MSK14-1 TaxID=1897632 RepID=UPI000D3724FB|nr:malonic semialdehyde reductase [Saccharospirillum sp. MSK14-1]PTY38421.1 malonic semialdehyde reductase [Saccharospirillum sp. MSK14-1]
MNHSDTRALPTASLEQLFHQGRSFSYWQDRAVPDALLRDLYQLVCLGPTSKNCSPLRLVFLRTEHAKQTLLPALASGNVAKVEAAPVTAILAYDRRFHDQLPTLFPHAQAARNDFVGNEPLREETALRNASLQGGYFIMAARALGLDCGPLSGFDNDAVDRLFFSDSAHHAYRSNFLCNLGYGDRSQLHDRLPRLSFEDCCQLL